MARSILLTGATGLLGTWLRDTAPEGQAVIPLVNRRRLADADSSVTADLRDRDATMAAVARAEPDVVVHAAYALDGPSIVDATRHVAAAAAAAGAGLVLTSTDAVFCGDGRVRAEDDAPDPIWDYGRWKAEAEQHAVHHVADATIVRLPLLVSVDPDDHVIRQIRRAAADGEQKPWFADELRQPALAREVAEAIWRIIGLGPEGRFGLWHLPGPEHLSRFEIAARVLQALHLDPDLIRPEPTPPTAVRPRDLRLGDERARTTIDWNPTAVLAT